MIWLAANWRYVAGGLGVLAVLGLLFHVKHSAHKEGKAACEAAYAEAALIAQKEAAEKIQSLEKTYAKKIKNLQAQGDSGVIAGPRTVSVLDGLRNNYAD